MRILYGIQATGNGHISRSREVIRLLKENGHHVEVIFSGREADHFWDMAEFEPYRVFKGLTFSTRNGKINYARTAARLRFGRFFKDIRQFDANGLDLVITDYEPLSARIARRHDLPCIGIGHQYAFQADIPVASANPFTRYLLTGFAPADYSVGLHWHHFDQPILPPIVAAGLDPNGHQDGQSILVYLPFEAVHQIKQLLQQFSNHRFFIYHAAISQTESCDHLHWRPFSRSAFLADLKKCAGVISNAGFELISEALFLGKKILVKPLAGQIEQLSNALALSQLSLSMVMYRLDPGQVALFLRNPSIDRIIWPDVAAELVKWLEAGQYADIGPLAERCWRRTQTISRASC